MSDDPILLRPIEDADLEQLRRLDTDQASCEPFQWFGFRSPTRRRKRWEEDGLIGRDSTLLAVGLPDGTMAGVVSWSAVDPGILPGVCVEIGILLFPEHRGRGLGLAAQRLLVDHLFRTTTVHRIQAGTDIDNLVEQRCLERLGFRREGVLRGIGFMNGQYRDGLMYARLRSDPPPSA
jgi:[ribosomal protein S5]-alanine N-acetyltransferase